MPTLLLASSNPGKLRELTALLEGLQLHLVDPLSARVELHVQESGDSYAANARLKASSFARASSLWALADDSGLEVEALSGAPGARSARLAGPNRTDADRRRRLLSMLRPHPRPWRARFRCVMALASPLGEILLAEGTCTGEIIPEERGSGGFGYDPIFLVQDTGRTMAELSLEEKNRLSHRAHALHALLPRLKAKMGLE